jgi:adenosylmethionine-8-amino-7-oxononanoate aminotransferase
VNSVFSRNLKREYPIVAFAKGAWITDTDGRRYLDACSGAVAANLGHGLTEINEAINSQLAKVAFAHTSQFLSEPALELAHKLTRLAPRSFAGGRVYFASGGTEAVETALKMARGFFWERGESSRHIVVSRWNSYHGSSIGALSVTGHPARRRPYVPILKDQPHISAAYPYRCPCGAPGSCENENCAIARADELESAILKHGPENIMAFIAEPIVGAALGAAVPGNGYWERIRKICTKYGVLLIADEVMTGLGRCGHNFALDAWQVTPDIIVVGKGLAAGYLPLSAVIASEDVMSAYENGSGVFEHGFTYSGHPASCAAGLAAINYLADYKVIDSVRKRQAAFFENLRRTSDSSIIGDLRGKGLMAGLELVANKETKEPFSTHLKMSQLVATEAAAEGLLVYPGSGFIDGLKGDHIIIAPPLNIEDADLTTLYEKLAVVIKRVEAKVSSTAVSR